MAHNGMRVIQERSSANTPTVAYTRGNDLSGSLEGAGGIGGMLSRSVYSGGAWGSHNFYHADGNGNVTALVDGSEALSAGYRYNPYGAVIGFSGGSMTNQNVYRFSSKEQMPNSGLYYFGYRFYDPYLQRWLNRDPIEEIGGINLYAMVRNAPTLHFDAFGLTIPGPPASYWPPPRSRPFPPDRPARPPANPLPPGFRYYPPGAASRGMGDWVPGTDLQDCLLAAAQRHLRRVNRDILHLAKDACIPGLSKPIELMHIYEALRTGDRLTESMVVRYLDNLACYLTWDAANIPPSYFPGYKGGNEPQ